MTTTETTSSAAPQTARTPKPPCGATVSNRRPGWALLTAALVAAVLGVASLEMGAAHFRLSRPQDIFTLPQLVIPASFFCFACAMLLALVGLRQLHRPAVRGTAALMALASILGIACFLTWATAGKSILLTGMIAATLVYATPIALGGMAGILSERVAIMNIAVEGMLLAGAFSGAVAGSLWGGSAGLAVAVATGGLMGLMLCTLVVRFGADQIIAGVAINILVLGLTSFVASQILSTHLSLNQAPVFRPLHFPGLSDLPVIGPILFQQNLFVYAAIAIALISTYYLFQTRMGLRSRAVGESAMAAETVGLNTARIRYSNLAVSGMVAGFGGAWFTLGSVGRFSEGMTDGLGYIGLAAMICGGWRPIPTVLVALLFGFISSLQQKLAILKTPIPSEFLAIAPYLATIVLVAGVLKGARAPGGIGKPL